MVVRLHPGQEHRISAYLEDQDKCAPRTWVHGSHTCDSLSSILGLEISFSAMPQDIDIQIIPGTQEPTNEGGAEVLKAMEWELRDLCHISEGYDLYHITNYCDKSNITYCYDVWHISDECGVCHIINWCDNFHFTDTDGCDINRITERYNLTYQSCNM